MRGLRKYLTPFAPDQSGAVSVLFEMGGLLVICDAGGCTGNICGFDEPRWHTARSAVFSAGLRDMDAILGRDEKLVSELADAAKKLNPAFACVIGTPVPSVIGTDYRALKRMAEARIGLPVLTVDTTGMELYDAGADKAYRALFGRFAETAYPAVPGRVGVLGVGNVGRRVIEYLRPFQVEVLACDPRLTQADAKRMGVELVSMEELFTNCNVVTCHLQNSVATEKLITYEYLSMMGEHTTFINNGDGSHIVNEDLVRACRENPTLTALIDKTDPQTTDPAGMTALPNVFRTPLIAGSMGNEVSRMGEYVCERCRQMLDEELGGTMVG